MLLSSSNLIVCYAQVELGLVIYSSPPFRPNRFVRLPVSFSPTEAGKSFEASLVISADPDIILTVQLQGSSAE